MPKTGAGMMVVPGCAGPPGHCGICHQVPRDEEDNAAPVIDTNVDIDYGDNLYICVNCARVIGALIDMVSEEDVSKLRADIAQLEAANEELEENNETLQGRIDRMIDGARAKREAKQGKKVKKND